MSASRGWNQREYFLALPDGVRLPCALPPALAVADFHDELQATISTNYPRLRMALRDCGLPFRETYSQREAAQVLGRSARTVRSWTRHNKIGCHSPSCRPYYTAANLEAHFAAHERPRPRKRAAK